MTAREYLEELQSRLFDPARARPREWEHAAPFIKELVDGHNPSLEATERERMVSELQGAFEIELPTRFQDPLDYKLLTGLFTRTVDAAQKVGLLLPERLPEFGSLPIGQLNAWAIRVPQTGELLIAFNTGVFGFANLLAKVVAQTCVLREEADGGVSFATGLDEILGGLERDPTPIKRLYEFLRAYVAEADPRVAPEYVLEGPHMKLAQILREGMELFIVGHELGHLQAGHLTAGDGDTVTVDEIERITVNHQREHEADTRGAAYAFTTMYQQGLDPALSYCGIELFFAAVELIERAVRVTLTGSEESEAGSDTHPPAGQRRELLRRWLREAIPPEAATNAISLSSDMQQILEELWPTSRFAFELAHKQHVPVAPSWTAAVG